jgi:hypothetical protein
MIERPFVGGRLGFTRIRCSHHDAVNHVCQGFFIVYHEKFNENRRIPTRFQPPETADFRCPPNLRPAAENDWIASEIASAPGTVSEPIS